MDTIESPAHAPLLRRTFELASQPVAGELRVIGLGDYQLWVNGERVTEGISNQPWSQYDVRIYWREIDIAPYLRVGANSVVVLLGSSFWYVAQPPAGRWVKLDAISRFDSQRPFLLSIDGEVTQRGGPPIDLRTGSRWQWAPSEVVFTHILAGEETDARRRAELIADDAWLPVETVPAPRGQFQAYTGGTLRAHEEELPIAVVERSPGVFSYLFAQNTSAVIRLEVEGERGQQVSLVPSEAITEEGDVVQLNLHGARASYEYTLSGHGVEVYEPAFFYHGFQYVRVEGAVPAGHPNPQGLPVVHELRSVHVRMDNPEVGHLATSSPLFDGIHRLVDWAVRSNSSYVLTDCPHREKLGWVETAYLLFPSIAYRYGVQQWYGKILQDLRDAQLPDGTTLTVAPYYLQLAPTDPFAYTVEWGAAAVILPWEHYRWYGDVEALRLAYPSMRAFIDNLALRSPTRIAPAGLGDWYDYGHGEPPGESRFSLPELTSTATFALATQAMIGAAQVLGERADVASYRALHAEIARAFWSRFYDPQAGALRHRGSAQTSHAMALEAGLVPPEHQAALLSGIVADLAARGWQQTGGDIGHVYMIRALARAGRSDVLHRVYQREGTGSYGGILAKQLTSLPETWDARSSGANSLNHAMLGHVLEWFYGYVLGIRQARDSVAWRRVVVGPEPGPLTWAQGRTQTPHGPIAVSWQRSDSELSMQVVMPPGVEAHAVLPAGDLVEVVIGGQPAPLVHEHALPAGAVSVVARYRAGALRPR